MFYSRKRIACLFGLLIFIFICVNSVNLNQVTDETNMLNPFKDLEYFGKSNARDITWAHAVNNQEKLENYLKSDIMMFEADVNIKLSQNVIIPIMAHPPKNDSDLTLEEFLNFVKKTGKGVKLDFKSIAAVKPAMKLLNTILSDTEKPLWLNADILPGPGISLNSNPPVDHKTFIQLCTSIFPNATLSLGWTTGWSKNNHNEGYTQAMVEQMAGICQNLTQVITFPLRAVYVRRSWKALKPLLESSPRYSLTIWSAQNDIVDVNDLVWLINQVDKRRLYMDIPQQLNDNLNKVLSSTGSIFGSSLLHCVIMILVVLVLT